MAKKNQSFENTLRESLGDKYDKIFVSKEKIEAISTGSFSLDISTGIGGFPKGRFSVLQGPFGAGKSTTVFATIRNVLLENNENRALYIDIENKFPLDYIPSLLGEGIDPDRVTVAKPETSDEGFSIAEAGIKSGAFQFIGFDSIGALAPSEEKERKFEQDTMALTPRDVGKFLRRNVFGVRTNNIVFLFVNQVRANVGAYVKSYSFPGGEALRHFTSLAITLTKESEIKVDNQSVGILTKFVIAKNSMSAPFRSFHYPIFFGKGIDFERDLIDFASFLGVIRKGGPYYKFNESTLGRGITDSANFIKSNPDVLAEITNQCYKFIGNTVISETEQKEYEEED